MEVDKMSLADRWQERQDERYTATFRRIWVARLPKNAWCRDPWIPGHVRLTQNGMWTATSMPREQAKALCEEGKLKRPDARQRKQG